MWLCGPCMGLHALSCERRHPNASVFAFGEDGEYIVGILRPVVGISRTFVEESVIGDGRSTSRYCRRKNCKI